MEERDSIKTKQKFCKICGGDSHNSEKNALFTELLVDQLIPPSLRNRFCGQEIFGFCSSCTEIVEELHQLNESLKAIQKNVQKKKTEIQLKILKNQYQFNDTEPFRNISTQGFYPRVEMNKNNVLSSTFSITSQNLSKLNQQYCKRRLPISPKKNEMGLEATELENYFSDDENKMDTLSNASKRSKITIDECEDDKDYDSEMQESPNQSLYSSRTYNDDKIQSELISIESKQTLPFHEEETIVKFEPWDDEFQNLEVTNNDNNAGSANEAIDIGQPFPNQECQIAQWTKPPLSFNELAVLAIMTSEIMLASVKEIYDFIRSNLPYYRQIHIGKSWKNNIRRCLASGHYITKRQNKLNFYGLHPIYNNSNYRNKLFEKLTYLSSCMEYPERIPAFQNSLKRGVIYHSNFVRTDDSNTIELTTVNNFGVSNSNETGHDFKENLIDDRSTNVLEICTDSISIQDHVLENGFQQSSSNDDTNFSPTLLDSSTENEAPIIPSISTPSTCIMMWPKPLLTCEDMCIMAILSTDCMFVSVSDAFEFIKENFPYYSMEMQPSCKFVIRHTLSQPKFSVYKKIVDNQLVTKDPKFTDKYYMLYLYTVSRTALTLNVRRRIANILSSMENMGSMAFPERIPAFLNLLRREIVDQSEFVNSNTSDNNFGKEAVQEDYHHIQQSLVNEDTTVSPILSDDSAENKFQSSSTDDTKYSPILLDSSIENKSPLLQPIISPITFVVWPKPILTCEDMCILAILSTDCMFVSVSDALAFIRENFPFYSMEMQPSCKFVIRHTLSQSKFSVYKKIVDNQLVTKDPKFTDKYYMLYLYTVSRTTLTLNVRRRIANILSSMENMGSMAFPDRVYEFMRNVLTKVVAPNLSVYNNSSNIQDEKDLEAGSISADNRLSGNEKSYLQSHPMLAELPVNNNLSQNIEEQPDKPKLYDYLFQNLK